MSELSIAKRGGVAGDTVYTEANLTSEVYTFDFPPGLCWQDVKTFVAVVSDLNGSSKQLWMLYKDEDVLKGTNSKDTSARTVYTPQATDTQIPKAILGGYSIREFLKAVIIA